MNLEFVCFFVAFEASEAAKFEDGQLAYLDILYLVKFTHNMFTACKNLKGAISFDRSKTDATYANWTTGYLTYKASTLNIKLDVDSNGSVNGYTEKAA